SNGAMVMMGFRPLEAGDGNGNKQRFLDIMRSIPAASIPGLPDYHPYQLKEMYFEFFRYLTGQDIYNGHNGWRDFDDSNAAKNTNLNAPEAVDAALIADDPALDFYPSWDDTDTNDPPTADDPSPVPVETVNKQTYVSPLDGINDCAKIYAINIGFGTANSDNDSDTAIQQSFANGGMGITLSGSNTQAQVIEFMNDIDLADETAPGSATPVFPNVPILDGKQNVVSYFIMDSANNTQDAWAAAGGTGSAHELGVDPDDLVELLSNIFESILSVSTTFVAPSVPVNVFNRSQTEDQVFLALFKADENGLPFWPGNLKKLQIGDVTLPDGTASFELQDATGAAAIDTDGRIKLDALTVWTTTGDTDMDGPIEDEAVDQKDGRAVERGGVGQQMPGYLPVTTGDPGLLNATTGARQLFTDDSASTPANLVALDATAANAALFFTELTRSWTPLQVDNVTPATTYATTRPVDQAKILDLLEYARGLQDDGVTKRSWFLGDPLHSRPLTINYGERGSYDDSDPNTENPDIRIFFGTNDGFFHSIKNTDDTGAETGDEIWAYMPREAMAVLEALSENIALTDPIHPITIDGSPIAVVNDGNGDNTIEGGTDYAIILFGLRRGGKSYYAIDVTDPDNPDLLYRVGKYQNPLAPATSLLNSDFEELSMTFSTPAGGFMDIGGTSTPVFIFGGGYNGDDGGDNVDDLAGYQDPTVLGKDQANRDEANALPTNSLGADDEDESTDQYEGNAIYIINAQTGALVWKATGGDDVTAGTNVHKDARMLDSVPAELTPVDTTGDGHINRIYWGDTGGRVWRADVGGGTVSSFDVHLILDAGRHVPGTPTREDDRRFFNRPDVVQATDGTNKFDAVLIGSGDREHPTGTDVENSFFMIKDPNIGLTGADTNFVHSNG
ncbi:MAG: PilC/PilY family type IV pilus protein, partial [Saprospiraceae bacterium]|nr:PilC/PilY family type IV pilus protein [Saprospiraceae bacterium]